MTTRLLKMTLALMLSIMAFGATAHHHQAQPATADAFAAANERMMHDMHGLSLTGDADYDFITGMLPHHQGAVDMARIMLDKGSDAALLALARDIIAAQEQEIALLNDWLENYGEPRPGEPAQDILAAWERINERMMRDMHQGASGNPDRDFAAGMIPHHVAAVDMSYVLLAYTQDSRLQKLARDVIREQEREIRQLNEWLAQHAAAEPPADHSHH